MMDAVAVQKKPYFTFKVSETAPGCFTRLLAKYFVDK